MIDPITEINDRTSFIKLLSSSVQQANENKSKLALLIISINRMQRVNEIYDYDTGDAALKYFAGKLNEAKRSNDSVGRLSGSTFGLILSPIMNKGHAQLAALKIIRLLEIPLEYKDHRIHLEISIGISICPSHSSLATGLLKKAEAALRLARQQEAKISITEDFAKDEITEFWDIELGIEQAIINSEFKLYYQPKINLQTGLPSGSEALIRWPHPNRGMIYPDQFIPVAEDHGHIKPMTIWILNVALRESSQWTTKLGPLSLSVNIPPDLMNEELVDLVDNALNIWHPENVTLVLEILERSFALTNDDTFSTFEALQNLGTDISIDDFGTGYSALSYFKSIPARELKIDKSFILNLLDEKGNYDIVTFIIQLAHAFNMRIVAEGVEDIKTMKVLKALGCDYMQGYVAAKAMPHEEFVKYLEDYSIKEQPFAELYNSNQAVTNILEKNIVQINSKEDLEDLIDIIENSGEINNQQSELKITPELISTKPPKQKIETDKINQEEAFPEIEIIDNLSIQEHLSKQSVKVQDESKTSKNKKDPDDLIGSIDFGDTII
ncbi:MAG: bifunctional diguanylate cyclase/phosphodiesterase [Pseudomonadota bacterium]